MVSVEEPFGEKLTFLWHNHFATAATKVRRATWMAAQNETLRREGLGSFATRLSSPALPGVATDQVSVLVTVAVPVPPMVPPASDPMAGASSEVCCPPGASDGARLQLSVTEMQR
jgi:hypothetical protein